MDFGEEEREAVQEVLKSGWPSRGKVTEEFEAELGKYLNSNVLVVNNCSSALLCSLLAYGIKAEDTVLVPDFTYVATASVPAILGCKIIPIDCELETFNARGENRYNERLESILLTDIAGLPIEPISDFPSNPPLIEDAAEAFGAETIRGKVGSREYLSCFSFQATKNISTIEGGAIASKNEELIEKCHKIANYGRTDQLYVHDILGMNMRITDMQSALGLVQLRKIDKYLKRRQEIADRYRKELPQFTFQKVPNYVTRHAWWSVMALTDRTPNDRNEILKHLQKNGIDARTPFCPVHWQPCFPEIKNVENYPNSWYLYTRGLTLPIYNSMTDEQLDYVISVANGNTEKPLAETVSELTGYPCT